MIDPLTFLTAAGWADATPEPLAGDASARRYQRLRHTTRGTAVLMLAPPEDRAGFEAFRRIAAHLGALGLSPPQILAADPACGLMLLEDLGDDSFAAADLGTPDGQQRYLAAVDVLVAIAKASPPEPLTLLNAERLAAMTGLAFDQAPDVMAGNRSAALAEMEILFAAHLTRPPVLILRDFHAENLLWLADRKGPARVGLLDFQDGVLGPPGYDLVSLLDDARRDVPEALRARALAGYARGLGLVPAALDTEAALLTFQRNLRIVGVFQRLAREHGKPQYLRHLPRVIGHVRRALGHPVLAPLRPLVTPLLDAAGGGPA